MAKRHSKKKSKKFYINYLLDSQLDKQNHHDEKLDFRKKRKEDKKNRAMGIESKISNKNMKVPNLANFKKSMVQDLEKKKQTSSRQELINSLKEKLDQSNNISCGNIYAYKIDADSKAMLYDNENDRNIFDEEEKRLNRENKDFSRRAYMKDLKEVIENSDVILEVLDSRDPLSCKSQELEELIRSQKDEKKIILILNKIDLIPIDNAIKWQKYFWENFKQPAIMFKANTQNQSSNLSSANIYKKSIIENKEFIDEVLHSNKSVGADKLLELLKNYCRVEGGGKRTITVGIVGYPNVGKSSIINSLKRGKVVGVSNTPGFTKGMTEISLDKDIKLLDCPGVVLSSKSDEAVLHNTIRTEDIKDPIGVVNMILKKISKSSIEEAYGIESNSWETIERFLYLIGDKLKKYKKGGVIDFDKVARIIVKDWNDGKLKYFTFPPNMSNEMIEVQMN